MAGYSPARTHPSSMLHNRTMTRVHEQRISDPNGIRCESSSFSMFTIFGSIVEIVIGIGSQGSKIVDWGYVFLRLKV